MFHCLQNTVLLFYWKLGVSRGLGIKEIPWFGGNLCQPELDKKQKKLILSRCRSKHLHVK